MGTRAQALWHPVHVVSVQEVAVVAALAQPPQPVLADLLPAPRVRAVLFELFRLGVVHDAEHPLEVEVVIQEVRSHVALRHDLLTVDECAAPKVSRPPKYSPSGGPSAPGGVFF